MSTKNIEINIKNNDGSYDILLPNNIDSNIRNIYGVGDDGLIGDVLEKLSKAVLYNDIQTPLYEEVTVDLSSVSEGNIIQLPEGGKLVDFYVAKLDYESGLNGAGRTLVVRKDVYDLRAWDAGDVNAWADSDLRAWLNGTYKALLGSDIQTAMGTTTYYYTPGNGNTSVSTRSDAVFLLSLTELGDSRLYANAEGTALPIAATLQIAYQNSSATTQWTRSPYTQNNVSAWRLNSSGSSNFNACNGSLGVRPCFTLPSTFTATYYVDSEGNLHDQQEYEVAGSTTDVQGNPITIGVQIATGSYVGTGTYGESNPNTLTFGFMPQLFFIGVSDDGLFIVRGLHEYRWNTDTQGSISVVFSWNGNNIKWNCRSEEVHASAYRQFNSAGTTYRYVAFGIQNLEGVHLLTSSYRESDSVIWNFSIPDGLAVSDDGAVNVVVTMTREGNLETWSSGRYVTYQVIKADGSGKTAQALNRPSKDDPAPTFTIPITNAKSKLVEIVITDVSQK